MAWTAGSLQGEESATTRGRWGGLISRLLRASLAVILLTAVIAESAGTENDDAKPPEGFSVSRRGLAKSAALELGRDGIRVNTVCPAGGNPEMYGPWMQQLLGMLDQARAYTEDRAIPGEAPIAAIADAVLFLASDESRHCTGADLPVDGGAHAGRFLPGFNAL